MDNYKFKFSTKDISDEEFEIVVENYYSEMKKGICFRMTALFPAQAIIIYANSVYARNETYVKPPAKWR